MFANGGNHFRSNKKFWNWLWLMLTSISDCIGVEHRNLNFRIWGGNSSSTSDKLISEVWINISVLYIQIKILNGV